MSLLQLFACKEEPMFPILIGVCFYIAFGLILPISGLFLVFAPNRWTRLPRWMRPALRGQLLPISTALSNSRSSKVMRWFIGALYIGLGAFVNILLVRALCIHR